MNVFLSWSGEPSRKVATALANNLKSLSPGIKPWMSEKIPLGKDWFAELRKKA
jgi:hypothetical protein